MSNDRMHDLDASNRALWAEVKAVRAENDHLRAELTVAQKRNSELLPIAAQCVRAVCHEHAVSRLERAEAAIDRVRELCAAHAGDDDVPRANVLAAIEGEQTGNHLD